MPLGLSLPLQLSGFYCYLNGPHSFQLNTGYLTTWYGRWKGDMTFGKLELSTSGYITTASGMGHNGCYMQVKSLPSNQR